MRHLCGGGHIRICDRLVRSGVGLRTIAAHRKVASKVAVLGECAFGILERRECWRISASRSGKDTAGGGDGGCTLCLLSHATFSFLVQALVETLGNPLLKFLLLAFVRFVNGFDLFMPCLEVYDSVGVLVNIVVDKVLVHVGFKVMM